MIFTIMKCLRLLGGQNKTGDRASRLLKHGVFTKENILDITDNAGGFVKGTLVGKIENSGEYGTETNVTNRNVATIRLAGMLGLKGFVEECKTVKVRDFASGNTYRGNMMSIAKGEEATTAAKNGG